MKIIKNNKTDQYKILKSKFIGYIFYVEKELDILEYINNLKKEYHDAKHICYGYILNNFNIQKYDDDNEPFKSSGFQILNLLIKNNITNCLIVIIRYFGGIKLGIGKLSRSYLHCAKLLIDDNLKDYIFYKTKLITFDYSQIKFVNNLINKYSLVILSKHFDFEKISYLIQFEDKFDFENNIVNKL